MLQPVHRNLIARVLALGVVWLAAFGLAAQTETVRFAVTAPAADMHSAPSADSDVVSQAIFGRNVTQLERAEGWADVQSADGYKGWIRLADLHPVADPYAAGRGSAMVSSLFASLYREPDIEKHAPVITIPFESRLEITGEKETSDGRFFSVRMPDGTETWIQSGDVNRDPKPLSIAATIALARRFLGLPYRWGGTTAFGFDCSGFTQMLMRQRGFAMPRDTRPQAAWDQLVPVRRAALKPGDLLFFGRTKDRINHTGMYIGHGKFINATRHGFGPVVQIDRLADEPWTSQFITARRVK